MVAQRAGDVIQAAGTGTVLKRRGILAAAGVVVAGIMAKQAAEPVAAANGDLLVLGSVANAATAETGVLNSGSASPGGPAIHGFRSPGAVTVVSTTLNAGVVGQTFVSDAPGVLGTSPNGAQAKGVHGISSAGFGIYGESPTGTGVEGTSGGLYGVFGTTTKAGGVGVGGTVTGGFGVLGTAGDGYGVLGQAVTGYGLSGFSQQNHGIIGQTARPFFGGVLGVATIANTVGIYGTTNGVASAFAGYMDGNFVVANGVKSAAVPHTDGSHRLVYCMESPESWFEDFGEGKLVGGNADVKLDPDFAAVVETGAYHVFLTTYGEQGSGLNVGQRRADGFSVVERDKGTSNLTFSYRIVARRKDIKAGRLAKFEMPKIKIPDVSKLQRPAPPQAEPSPLSPATP